MGQNFTPKQQEALNKMLVDALRGEDLTQVELCVAKGAEIAHQLNLTNTYLETGNVYRAETIPAPLFHFAITRTILKEELIDYFQMEGVPVDVPDQKGNTALLWAVRWADSLAVDCLLKHGADPLACNAEKASPLDEAYRLMGNTGNDRKKNPGNAYSRPAR